MSNSKLMIFPCSLPCRLSFVTSIISFYSQWTVTSLISRARYHSSFESPATSTASCTSKILGECIGYLSRHAFYSAQNLVRSENIIFNFIRGKCQIHFRLEFSNFTYYMFRKVDYSKSNYSDCLNLSLILKWCYIYNLKVLRPGKKIPTCEILLIYTRPQINNKNKIHCAPGSLVFRRL